mmetsp:Transcript_53895/g.157225  ORF Transcript_53895/g.157225 Transcript_53895/m.157225 type:complete len:482 (+) Transcript_53895:680-2125(+)
MEAAIKEGVVDDLVGLAAGLLLEVLQDGERGWHVALLREALDQGAVRDEVRLQAPPPHAGEQLRHPLHLPVPRAGVDHRVVGDHGRLDATRQHLLEDGGHALHVPGAAVTLEHGSKDHGVDLLATLVILKQGGDELVSPVHVAVCDNSLHHAADGDARGLHMLRPHLLPAPPSAGHVLGISVGLDQAPKGVSAGDRHGILALELLQPLRQERGLAHAHAGLHHRGEEHLVHGLLRGVRQLQRADDVRVGRLRLQALEQDRAGDAVGGRAVARHLVDDVPDLRPAGLALAPREGVDELVVGHMVWRDANAAHLVHEGAGALVVLLSKVRLDEGVVGHDIRNLRGLHALHQGLRAPEVAALHAGVQGGVPQRVRELRAARLQRAESLHGLLQVALGGARADHGDVLRRVPGRGLQEARGEVLATTLQRSSHHAALRARVHERAAPVVASVGVVELAGLLGMAHLCVEADKAQDGRDLPHLLWL